MTYAKCRSWIVSTILAATLVACGGDSVDRSQTIVSGLIVLPSSDHCSDCNNSGVNVVVLGLQQNGSPQVLASLQTNSHGIYKTQDLTPALNATNASADSSGDGKRSIIVVASVNSNGAQIGGVISAPVGAIGTKDFNPTTHVACLASVFLTAGTASFNPVGCTVAPTCAPTAPNCLVTVNPDDLTSAHINNLEQAASFVSDQIDFPNGVPAASCAILVCTNGGVQSTDANCVTAALAAAMQSSS